MDEEWKEIAAGMKHPAVAPAKDWEVRPRSPWNYGLVVTAGGDGRARRAGEAGRRVPVQPARGADRDHASRPDASREWTIVDGSAGPLPQSPVASKEKTEAVTLVPYGAAKLRVTEFPVVRP